jgi:hypothetical protein
MQQKKGGERAPEKEMENVDLTSPDLVKSSRLFFIFSLATLIML